jgi:FMN reductase
VLKVVIVVGNPKPGSRTRTVAETLVQELLVPDSRELRVIELSEYAEELFSQQSERVAELSAQVASADLAVFASPTYKASYTGLLKAFLDRYGTNGLAGVVAIPVHTGGNLGHSMTATHVLAPLLAELGAVVPGRGFYLAMTDIEQLKPIVRQAAQEYAANLRRLVTVANAAVAVV